MGARASAAALLCALLALACAGAEKPDIVLITVDTLRADHLGIYGYERATSPNIDRFFERGVVYERAYSASASTAPSVVSILTGRLPREHGIRLHLQLVPGELPIVTDHLPGSYQTAAFVSSVVLTQEALGIADRFDHYDDFVDEKESARPKWERRAARTTDAALAWLRAHRDPARPLFLWVHYIDPHGPYRPPADWEPTFRSERSQPMSDGRVLAYQLDPAVANAYLYLDRYDEEIRYMDAHVGRLLDGYGPRLAEAIVLFTADHGETMIEQEWWFAHGYQVYESIVRVPLLVREPGRPTRRIRAPAQGTDLAPTILRAAGVDLPDGMPLVDLRHAEGLADDRLILVDTSLAYGQWTAAIRGDRKRMLRVRGRNREVMEGRGYDLADDPHETRPLEWDPDDPLAKVLLDRVQSDPDPSGIPEKYAKGMKLSAPKVAPGASEEMLEKLRALGYAN